MAYRGKSLKAARLSKGIELRSVANKTRIGLPYLEDLEEERFDRFPGKFYFTSFSKAYAGSLGLDPDEVAMDLGEAYEDWSRGTADGAERISTEPREDEGLWGRITEFIRRVQEV